MSLSPPQIPGRLWAVAAITGSGVFMAMLDSTIANLALEAIRSDLAAPLSSVQWVATGYLIALAVSLPLTGWLGRRIGDGRLWKASILAFVLASIVCALAQSVTQLIVARCLQGLAAGLMVPAGQAVLASTAERRQLGRLMGIVGFAIALGPALGPAFGGVLIDTGSWRWLFLINGPVGAAALIGAARLVPPGNRSEEARIDARGLMLIGFGLPLLLYGAAEIGSNAIGMLSLAILVLGTGLTSTFVVHAIRTPDSLIDVALLARSDFAAPVVTAGLTGAAMYGGLLLLPIYLQRSLGQTSTEAGLMLMAMGLGSACILPVAGALTDRHGPRGVSLTGCGLLVIATLPFLTSAAIALPAIILFLVTRGAGLALAQMPAITAAYNQVDETRTADAATLINIAQRLGGALGAIAMVAVIEQFGVFASATAYQIAFGALVVMSFGAQLAATRIKARGQAR
ncbi:DHA2 family efflux MFS transporter permease subunit [Martelella mediterranea]|uniref:DHA2 family efflux MFS transporter permease subunit n=1 Tax=Martelella mediterranea TaxID=293089 RepID=UPI001E645EC1|nr:DHA2 family efflux MFS transporter permease subunit [Martelella mediterranea]MCD1635711.1 DHA2 family efflux MFS transporter permease subunit [Martelella mediterranea]